MKTVGQILQKTRQDLNLTLKQVEAQTKIRQEILIALEEDNFQKLSSIASIKGLLKTYAEFLNLPTEQILAIFRRDFNKKDKKKVIPQGLIKPLDRTAFFWTPKKVLIFLVTIFFLGLCSYLGYQYWSLIKPPFLKIDFPQANLQVDQSSLEIIGQADPDSLLKVNGEPVLLDSKGKFKYKVELFPGENKVTIEANSKLGKKNKAERIIFYQPKD